MAPNYLATCAFICFFCLSGQLLFLLLIVGKQRIQRVWWLVAALFAAEFLLSYFFPPVLSVVGGGTGIMVVIWVILTLIVSVCSGCQSAWGSFCVGVQPAAVKTVSTRDTEKLKKLIEKKKIPVNDVYAFRQNDGKKISKTLLQMAAEVGFVPTAQLLVENGAELENTGAEGLTPLWWACFCNRLGMIKYLLQAGAKAQHTGVGNVLVAASANEHAAEAIRLLVQAGANVNEPDQDGNTALMHASARFRLANVRTLLELQADVNQANPEGKTALAFACQNQENWLNSCRAENRMDLYDPDSLAEATITLLKEHGAK